MNIFIILLKNFFQKMYIIETDECGKKEIKEENVSGQKACVLFDQHSINDDYNSNRECSIGKAVEAYDAVRYAHVAWRLF